MWHKGTVSFLFPFSQSGYAGIDVQLESRTLHLENVYFGCSIRRKILLWSNLIREKYVLRSGSLVIGGDFNTGLSHSKRRGKGSKFSEEEVQDF